MTVGRTTDDPHLATLGRLTRGALHEIANPLLALLGTAEFALAEAEPGTRLRERIETVHATALEIAEIVRALQAFARQRHEPPRRVALAETAEGAVGLVRLVGATPDVELVLEIEGQPRAHDSPAAVSRAIVELLLDALAAAQPGETIELVVRQETSEAVAAISGGGDVRFPAAEVAT